MFDCIRKMYGFEMELVGASNSYTAEQAKAKVIKRIRVIYNLEHWAAEKALKMALDI